MRLSPNQGCLPLCGTCEQYCSAVSRKWRGGLRRSCRRCVRGAWRWRYGGIGRWRRCCTHNTHVRRARKATCTRRSRPLGAGLQYPVQQAFSHHGALQRQGGTPLSPAGLSGHAHRPRILRPQNWTDACQRDTPYTPHCQGVGYNGHCRKASTRRCLLGCSGHEDTSRHTELMSPLHVGHTSQPRTRGTSGHHGAPTVQLHSDCTSGVLRYLRGPQGTSDEAWGTGLGVA